MSTCLRNYFQELFNYHDDLLLHTLENTMHASLDSIMTGPKEKLRVSIRLAPFLQLGIARINNLTASS